MGHPVAIEHAVRWEAIEMARPREHGAVQPGIAWGPFTLRIPLIHARLEWPELVQGLLVAGATGLSIVPIYMTNFGMSFETAVALCVVQAFLISGSPMLFGDPFCPGWLTPALPLILREALLRSGLEERVDFVNAVVLTVAATFLFFGITGLGPLFLRWVPRVLQAGIILGAGMSAIYGEFLPRGEGPSRLDQYTVCILLSVGVTLLLLFSTPLETLKARFRWLGYLAAMGIAPGFFLAMVVGPWVGEVSYDGLRGLFVDSQTGEWVFGLGDLFLWPEFGRLWTGYSPLAIGFPGFELYLEAVPLAVAAYIIGFGDIITGTAILKEAQAHRPDEKIPFDERRTHLSLGIRNGLQTLLTGPFFPLQGPLWTAATVVVAERFRRGRQVMDSIFGGIFSYYVLGIPILLFVRPFVELVRPVLNVAFSLTLLLTGFACAFVALAMVRDRIERGLAVLIGMLIMYFSTFWGLVVGVILTLLLMGPGAWKSEEEAQPGGGS